MHVHLGRTTCLLTLIASLAALASAEDEIARTDYLTFAQGAIPVSTSVFGAKRDIGPAEAMQAIDGDTRGFSMLSQAGADGGAELVFELPAVTTFDRFAVPEVLETPSPGQTFFREVEVHGSSTGPEGPWQALAATELKTHASRGLSTEIVPAATVPVRWVKVRLSGGIEVLRDLTFLEFSEIVGNGKQETPPLADDFHGTWKGRGVLVELKQDGASVSGCVDRDGDPFTGTVTGNILRGQAVDDESGVVSLFILTVDEKGGLRGVRSTNGAPFRVQAGDPAPKGTTTACSDAEPPAIGCDSVLHGINFDFDSADIRPDSGPLLQQLFEGLKSAPKMRILIEGHTSSEGTAEYNQRLSERRAQAVVDDLVRRGIEPARISAAGRGEASPIASNDTESGRSLNRRVEVHCSSGG